MRNKPIVALCLLSLMLIAILAVNRSPIPVRPVAATSTDTVSAQWQLSNAQLTSISALTTTIIVPNHPNITSSVTDVELYTSTQTGCYAGGAVDLHAGVIWNGASGWMLGYEFDCSWTYGSAGVVHTADTVTVSIFMTGGGSTYSWYVIDRTSGAILNGALVGAGSYPNLVATQAVLQSASSCAQWPNMWFITTYNNTINTQNAAYSGNVVGSIGCGEHAAYVNSQANGLVFLWVYKPYDTILESSPGYRITGLSENAGTNAATEAEWDISQSFYSNATRLPLAFNTNTCHTLTCSISFYLSIGDGSGEEVLSGDTFYYTLVNSVYQGPYMTCETYYYYGGNNITSPYISQQYSASQVGLAQFHIAFTGNMVTSTWTFFDVTGNYANIGCLNTPSYTFSTWPTAPIVQWLAVGKPDNSILNYTYFNSGGALTIPSLSGSERYLDYYWGQHGVQGSIVQTGPCTQGLTGTAGTYFASVIAPTPLGSVITGANFAGYYLNGCYASTPAVQGGVLRSYGQYGFQIYHSTSQWSDITNYFYVPVTDPSTCNQAASSSCTFYVYSGLTNAAHDLAQTIFTITYTYSAGWTGPTYGYVFNWVKNSTGIVNVVSGSLGTVAAGHVIYEHMTTSDASYKLYTGTISDLGIWGQFGYQTLATVSRAYSFATTTQFQYVQWAVQVLPGLSWPHLQQVYMFTPQFVQAENGTSITATAYYLNPTYYMGSQLHNGACIGGVNNGQPPFQISPPLAYYNVAVPEYPNFPTPIKTNVISVQAVQWCPNG